MLYTVLSHCILLFLSLSLVAAVNPLVSTSSGRVRGSEVTPGVLAWKGIPYAVPPIGGKRWAPPKENKWNGIKGATSIGVVCIQQLTAFRNELYNTPPFPEGEDCLTINIWAPKNTTKLKAVIFFIHGGGFAYGGSYNPLYDGTSFAKNQDIVLVTFNYRANVFGYPNAPDIPLEKVNLGLLDQHLALKWTHNNIREFGGDPKKIAIVGHSTGSVSVGFLIQKYFKNPPFRAAIQLSGRLSGRSSSTTRNFTTWNAFAEGVGCNGTDLTCLRNVPSNAIRQFVTDSPLVFSPIDDGGSTVRNAPLTNIAQGKVARVPLMIGHLKDDFSVATVGLDNLTTYLGTGVPSRVPNDSVRTLYPVPGKYATDTLAIVAIGTDLNNVCTNGLVADAMVQANFAPVYRYAYGAFFDELQVFPNAGVWHTTELGPIFGNLRVNASEELKQLSPAMQTIWANFAKSPNQPPAPNWLSSYNPAAPSVAALAYNGNYNLNTIVEAKLPSDFDLACAKLWNPLLIPDRS